MDIIDLHIHTECSDGSLKISDLSSFAKENNIKVLSITDHDNVDAYSLLNKEYSSDLNYKIIPGVEITTEHNNSIIHLLGYGMDINNKEFNMLIRQIKLSFATQMTAVLRKLRNRGIVFEDEKQWVIKGLDKLAVYLVERGYFDNTEAFFYDIFYCEGKRVLQRKKPKSRDVIEAVNKAGGFVSLAHPVIISNNLSEIEELIIELKSLGLSAVECYHPLQSNNYNEYIAITKRHNLLITGGSDFHDSNSIEYLENIKKWGYSFEILGEVFDQCWNNRNISR